MMIQIPLDLATLIGGLFIAATAAFFGMLAKLVRSVDRIENKLGSPEDPDSILGKLKEFGDLRDWAIKQGYHSRGESK